MVETLEKATSAPVVSFSPPRPPTPILPHLCLRCIAPLRLRLAIELPTRHMVDAPLARISGEVALDWLGSRACPGALWRNTGAPFGPLAIRLRNGWRRSRHFRGLCALG